jgi:hypothetical protein
MTDVFCNGSDKVLALDNFLPYAYIVPFLKIYSKYNTSKYNIMEYKIRHKKGTYNKVPLYIKLVCTV